MKKKITETQLRKMISESIQSTLNEIGNTEAGQWMLGRLAGRNRLTWDDYDRHHCEDGKNVEPFMNGYDWEDTPRWAEDLSQQYDDAGKPDEFYDAYWKQKDYLDNYADSMKSKIRANAMTGRNQAINEDEEFDEMQFEKEWEILTNCCNQVAYPLGRLMDNIEKYRPIYCKEYFDKVYDAAVTIASYADVGNLSAETDIRYKYNG